MTIIRPQKPGEQAASAEGGALGSALPVVGVYGDIAGHRHISTNIKIGVESQRQCLGACGGCILSQDERRGTDEGSAGIGRANPFVMSTLPHAEKLMAQFMARFLDRLGGAADPVGEDHAAVHFVQGDHCLLPHEDIDALVEAGARAVKGRSRLLFSTSLIGKTERFISALDRFKAAAQRTGQTVSMLPVLDPARIVDPRLSPLYDTHLKALLERFEIDEPILNVGPDIAETSQHKDIDAFLKRYGFEQVEIALFPVRDMARAYAARWGETVAWLRDFIRVFMAQGTYSVRLIFSFNVARRETADLDMAAFHGYLAKRLSEAIYIDGFGQVHHAHPMGIADITPLTTRFGYKPLGRAKAGAASNWAEQGAAQAHRTIKQYLRDPRCAGCPHMKACAAAGFNLIRTSIGPALEAAGTDSPDCPIGLKPLFDEIAL